MTKPILFISHISEEKEIAHALKEVLEKSFLGNIDVFVSSNPNSIKLGNRWLQNITNALKSCVVEIVIASPISIKRPWINFEAGAGWVRDIPVIPLCHSGMTPSTLPVPLCELQAAVATDHDKLAHLVSVIADAFESGEPKINWDNFIDTVRKYEQSYADNSDAIEKLEQASPIPPNHGLLPHELAVLLIVGNSSLEEDSGCSTWMIGSEMEAAGYTKIAAKLATISLARKNLTTSCLIDSSYGNEPPSPGVRITDEGWLWLEKFKEQLALIHVKPKTEARPKPMDDIPF